MRIWTFHPEYLDRQGLLALWRESLLAQKVLAGSTKGYTAHPQLTRFRDHPDPLGAIGFYLVTVYRESVARGYQFDRSKILSDAPVDIMLETDGQLIYEWRHFMSKLVVRAPDRYRTLKGLKDPEPHPIFYISEGGVKPWERIIKRKECHRP